MTGLQQQKGPLNKTGVSLAVVINLEMQHHSHTNTTKLIKSENRMKQNAKECGLCGSNTRPSDGLVKFDFSLTLSQLS